MENPTPVRSPRCGLVASAVCAGLLILFTCVAWRAVRTKSPAFDEPYHALSAWTSLRYFDYRIDCEDPPLWKYWAALPNGKSALSADFSADSWTHQPKQMQLQWIWTVDTLYRTPANNSSDNFVQRSRAMMLALGPLLGGLIGWWAWRIGGAVAAIVATALFCFDPNFLAHAPLVKNDIVFSLAMFGLVYNLWRAGQRLTWLRVIFVALLCGVMLTVKFSGPLAGVLIPLMLGIRALMAAPWFALGRNRETRGSRLAIAVGVTLLAAVVGIGSIWAAYGFRFDPTPQPGARLNTALLAQMAAEKELAVRSDAPTSQPTTSLTPSFFVRTLQTAGKHHLLPQAWVAGLLFTYQSSLVRPEFMNGQYSLTGWRYYNPFAMMVKTPVATLAAGGLAIFMILRRRPRGWTVISIAVPFLVYLQSAMMSDLNIGVRHVLPLYPFIFVTIGWAAAVAWRRWPSVSAITLVVLMAGLSVESLAAFPSFIPFFNTAAGGSAGGFHLLGDSNLDWGQDLPLLVDWQKRNPQTRLYLSYFGLADPKYYGIRYVPLPGGYHYDPKPFWPERPCVMAVSASYLQGLYVPAELYQQFYKPLARQQPIEILGGSIYLFAYP